MRRCWLVGSWLSLVILSRALTRSFVTDAVARGPLQAITSATGEVLQQVRLGDFEQFSFKGWNDETVYGYVVKPYDYQPGKKYPVAFLIHGGPQGSFGNSWRLPLESANLCGPGVCGGDDRFPRLHGVWPGVY